MEQKMKSLQRGQESKDFVGETEIESAVRLRIERALQT